MARKLKPETRAKRLCESISENKYEQAMQLALNLLFMEEKLDETRERISGMPTAIEYDNGGGQSGIRVNPEYQAYENLLKSYCSTLKSFCELTGMKADKTTGGELAAFRGRLSFSLDD